MSDFADRGFGAAPRILIVRVGAMGDVIHALPAVARLREALPDAYIGWAIEPRWAPLLQVEGATARDPERMPLVDAVHRVDAKQWNKEPFSVSTARSIARLRRHLRADRYDVAVDVQGTLRSAVIARLSGASGVLGSDLPRERIARLLYRTCVPCTSAHVTDQASDLLRCAFTMPGLTGAPPDLPETEEQSHPGASGMLPLLPRDGNADAWWQQHRAAVCGKRVPVLLAATAGWGAKEWPPEKFAELVIRLADRGYCVLLNTGPGTVDPVTQRTVLLARERSRGLSSHVHTLQATLPRLVAATREMNAMIAGDTGPLHLAAALGIPTVGIFGPTAPERTGPRGARAINLRDPGSVTDHRRHAGTEAGLANLAVRDVLDAFDSVTRTELRSSGAR